MLWPRTCATLAALAAIHVAAALPNCPIQGQEFPEPRNLAEHPIWKEAIASLTAVYDWHDQDQNGTTGAKNFSYSVQVFSGNPGQEILFERYHTAPNLPTLNSTGVKKVDSRTVYRLGSITKVYTVLAWLVAAGDAQLNDPVAKYLPEVAAHIEKNKGREDDGVWKVDWEDITIGALMGQQAGIQRDCKSTMLGFWGPNLTTDLNSGHSR
jgi:CubicO group peptidase (beta-lactamase class C family)